MENLNSVQVTFYTSLRQVVGQRTVEIPAAITVRDLIREIVQAYPDLEPVLISDGGQLLTHISILVNGRDIRHLESNYDYQLKRGDQVSKIPALGGGQKV